MDVRAFGPLYSGFTNVEQLRLAGLMSGDRDTMATLEVAFAGSPPVMFEFF